MLHFDLPKRRDGVRSFAERQPSVYATRLAKQPTVISRGDELASLRAAYHHAKTPSCVELRCPTCRDLSEVERLLAAGRPVELHPIVGQYLAPEGSRSRETK